MKCPRRLGPRSGNAILEFALAASLLVPAFCGVFQFGYSFYLYNELEEAVRTGVRYASLLKISNSGDGSTPSAYQTNVKNMVVYGSPSPANGAAPVVPGLATSNVSVVATFDASNVPTYVTVSISSYTVDAIFKTFTFTGKPVLKMPFFGQYCSTGTGC